MEDSLEDQNQKINGLIVKLDSLEIRSRKSQLENLSLIINWSDSTDKRIRNIFKSISFNSGKQIVQFKELRNDLTAINSLDSMIPNRLIILKSQLIDLRTDINNDIGSNSQNDTNILVESLNISQIEGLINLRDSGYRRIMTNFIELQSNLDSSLNVILINE
ncbi:MAG: hypothetical protein ACPG8K_02470 [Crocinitomicaceae bacterium]